MRKHVDEINPSWPEITTSRARMKENVKNLELLPFWTNSRSWEAGQSLKERVGHLRTRSNGGN